MAVSERRQDGERHVRSYARMVADLDEQRLVDRARRGDSKALDQLIKKYVGFVRMKSSSYFIADVDVDCTIGDCLPGSEVDDPASQIISTQELRSLVDHMTSRLSPLEAQVLT